MLERADVSADHRYLRYSLSLRDVEELLTRPAGNPSLPKLGTVFDVKEDEAAAISAFG